MPSKLLRAFFKHFPNLVPFLTIFVTLVCAKKGTKNGKCVRNAQIALQEAKSKLLGGFKRVQILKKP